jgi:hypothetical protein
VAKQRQFLQTENVSFAILGHYRKRKKVGLLKSKSKSKRGFYCTSLRKGAFWVLCFHIFGRMKRGEGNLPTTQ